MSWQNLEADIREEFDLSTESFFAERQTVFESRLRGAAAEKHRENIRDFYYRSKIRTAAPPEMFVLKARLEEAPPVGEEFALLRRLRKLRSLR